MKNNNYTRHVPYLRNSIAYDPDFWYTSVKWYLQAFFSVFQNFGFLGCWGVQSKITKSFVHHASYLRNHWLPFMVHMCKMIISPECFFSFSKFWFCWLFGGGKGGGGGIKGKNGPKWQKILFVTLRILGTMHHMIVIYGANV